MFAIDNQGQNSDLRLAAGRAVARYQSKIKQIGA
jgi:hypothetical protein